jgi:hypothetical protein
MILVHYYNLLIPAFIRYVPSEAPYFSNPEAGQLKKLLFPVIPAMLVTLVLMVIAVMLHLYWKQRRFH